MKLVPQALKERLGTHFVTVAQQFASSPNKKLYTTYYSFTTCNFFRNFSRIFQFFFFSIVGSQEIIFPSLTLFNPGSELLETFSAAKPPPFKVTSSSMIPYFPIFPTRELESLNNAPFAFANIEVIPILRPPMPVLQPNASKYSEFFNSLMEIASSFEEAHKNHSIPPILAKFVSLIDTHYSLSQILESLDAEFLNLSQKTFINSSSSVPIRVPCELGSNCSEPPVLATVQIQIHQDPNIK